eukprot:3492103-Pleurochrysis_carterae.AAC.1
MRERMRLRRRVFLIPSARGYAFLPALCCGDCTPLVVRSATPGPLPVLNSLGASARVQPRFVAVLRPSCAVPTVRLRGQEERVAAERRRAEEEAAAALRAKLELRELNGAAERPRDDELKARAPVARAGHALSRRRTRARSRTRTRAHALTHTRTRTRAHAHEPRSSSRTHAHVQLTLTLTRTCTRARSRIRTHAHTLTHTRSRASAHACRERSYPFVFSAFFPRFLAVWPSGCVRLAQHAVSIFHLCLMPTLSTPLSLARRLPCSLSPMFSAGALGQPPALRTQRASCTH